MGGLASPLRSRRHPPLLSTLTLSLVLEAVFCLLSQLSAIDVSARTTMKDAANCDKHCDLQNSVNQWSSERKLRFRDIPESMPASVSNHILPATRSLKPCVSEVLLFWCLSVFGIFLLCGRVLDTASSWIPRRAAWRVTHLWCCFVCLRMSRTHGYPISLIWCSSEPYLMT